VALLAGGSLLRPVGAATPVHDSSHDTVRGLSQSPLNISSQSTFFSASLPPVNFKVLQPSSSGSKNLAPVQSGFPLTVTIDHGNFVARTNASTQLAVVTYQGITYGFQSFHLHAASEHQIDGATFPAELHLVFQDQATPTPHRLVLGRFLTTNATSDAVLQPFFNILSLVTSARSEDIQLSNSSLSPLFTPSPGSSYRYGGSLTTPPFDEGVQWIVYDTPLSITAAEFQMFKNACTTNPAITFPSPRSPQPANGRVVLTDKAGFLPSSVDALRVGQTVMTSSKNIYLNYVSNLTSTVQGAALAGGWRYSVVSKLYPGSNSSKAGNHYMYFQPDEDTSHRAIVNWFYNATGNLCANLNYNAAWTVTNLLANDNHYHLHELAYVPYAVSPAVPVPPAPFNTSGKAQGLYYYFDGQLKYFVPAASLPRYNTGKSPKILWGSLNSGVTGTMNYQQVWFGINSTNPPNTISYLAGFTGGVWFPENVGWQKVLVNTTGNTSDSAIYAAPSVGDSW